MCIRDRVRPTSSMSIPAAASRRITSSASCTPESMVRARVPWSSKAAIVGSGRVLTVLGPMSWSTSTKNPTYPDTLYVDQLIGPNTVNTLPEPTIAAFEDHGTLARTIDSGVADADEVMRRLAAAGIDMDDVGLTLEDRGVAGFHESFQDMLAGLAAKAHQRTRR